MNDQEIFETLRAYGLEVDGIGKTEVTAHLQANFEIIEISLSRRGIQNKSHLAYIVMMEIAKKAKAVGKEEMREEFREMLGLGG